MVGKKNEGSELVAVLMYVQVEVLGDGLGRGVDGCVDDHEGRG